MSDQERITQLEHEIAELRLDLAEAHELNKTRYQDGYTAAAGPLAQERIERLSTLWEGAKAMNWEYQAEISRLRALLADHRVEST